MLFRSDEGHVDNKTCGPGMAKSGDQCKPKKQKKSTPKKKHILEKVATTSINEVSGQTSQFSDLVSRPERKPPNLELNLLSKSSCHSTLYKDITRSWQDARYGHQFKVYHGDINPFATLIST